MENKENFAIINNSNRMSQISLRRSLKLPRKGINSNFSKHKILVIDGVFIVGTLAVLLGMFLYYQPVLNSPDNGARVTGAVLFSFEKANEILIDDNLDFSSPRRILAEDDLVINLEPGIYYWKVRNDGILNSEIRKLEVNSQVALRLEESEKGYDLVNAGDVPLDVDLFNMENSVDCVTLRQNSPDRDFGTKSNKTNQNLCNGTLTGKVSLDVAQRTSWAADSFVGREK